MKKIFTTCIFLISCSYAAQADCNWKLAQNMVGAINPDLFRTFVEKKDKLDSEEAKKYFATGILKEFTAGSRICVVDTNMMAYRQKVYAFGESPDVTYWIREDEDSKKNLLRIE